MERREFLEGVAAWSAGLAVSCPLFRIVPRAIAAERPQPLVAVAKGADYEALVAKALEPLGGMSALVKKGDRVVVKPNIAWDRKPEQAANTHPLVVKALVKAALDAGASSVTVFDRPCQDVRRTYAASGIIDAVKTIDDKRVSWFYVEEDDRKFVPVKIEKGKDLKEWQFHKDALEADCYVNVPIAKHHRLAKLTLGVKNVLGVVGGNRGQIHQAMGRRLAELNTVIRPKLTVIDATRILLRNGPVGGNLEDVKVLDTLIASADTVAADAYATTLFDMKPDDVDSTREAFELGLGEKDLSRVKVIQA
ncbi:MAG: DUF362 domain-containing protein [Planctomycetota bacterium]